MGRTWRSSSSLIIILRLSAIFTIVNGSSGINGTSPDSRLKCYNCTWINAEVKGQRGRGLTRDAQADNSCTNTCVVDINTSVCVKEVIKQAGVIRSVKRFCAASSETGGCFEHVQDGTATTICLCNDWHSCNAATSTTGPRLTLFLSLYYTFKRYLYTLRLS